MKTLGEINRTLEAFEKKFGMPVRESQQGSGRWLELKLGVLSASNASKVVAKKDSETRLTYMCDLISEICTGTIEEMNFKQLEWGKAHEDAARSSYEFDTGRMMTQVLFVFKDESYREGSSPDGIIEGFKGSEIKCPWDSSNFVKFLVSDKIKPDWQWQNQFNMRVTDATSWDFMMYDPRMTKSPYRILPVDRDEKMQATLADAVPQFISDMDEMLKKIGIEFGDQWKRIGALS